MLWVPKEGMTALQSHSAPFCMIFKRCLLKCETDEILASQQPKLAIISVPILCVCCMVPWLLLPSRIWDLQELCSWALRKQDSYWLQYLAHSLKWGSGREIWRVVGCVHVSVIKTVCVLEIAQRTGQDLVSFVTFLLQSVFPLQQQSPNIVQ